MPRTVLRELEKIVKDSGVGIEIVYDPATIAITMNRLDHELHHGNSPVNSSGRGASLGGEQIP